MTSPGAKLMWLLDRSQMEGWRRNERLTEPKDPELLSEREERKGEGGRGEERRDVGDVGRYFPRPSVRPLRLTPFYGSFSFFLSFTAPCVLVAVQMILLCGAAFLVNRRQPPKPQAWPADLSDH